MMTKKSLLTIMLCMTVSISADAQDASYSHAPFSKDKIGENLFKAFSKRSQDSNALLEQIDKDVFPKGNNQMTKELNKCAKLLNVPASQIKETFIFACTRVVIGPCDRETLIYDIACCDSTLSDGQLNEFAKFIFVKLIKQKGGTKGIDKVLHTWGFIDGPKYDKIPNGYGEFGIEVTNPVPVNGIPANETYLNRLVTTDGLSLKWKRRGCRMVSGIEYPIDVYQITDENGLPHPDIYISSYHASTSNIAPKGYKFK